MLWRPETEEIAVTDRTEAAGLQVATRLYRFIEDEALPAAGTGLIWSPAR